MRGQAEMRSLPGTLGWPLAVVAAAGALVACDGQQSPTHAAADKPSLWLSTMTSSDDPTPRTRRECRRPAEMFVEPPQFLRPLFALLPQPRRPCSTSATTLSDGSRQVRDVCNLPTGTVATSVAETSADGRTIRTRTDMRPQSRPPTWFADTAVRLGDCPVPMPSDQLVIWQGPDGKWTDRTEEQEKLLANAGHSAG